jgi:glyoxylase-like metal-dependent hydrolase (beta-lactamase superfamily II)
MSETAASTPLAHRWTVGAIEAWTLLDGTLEASFSILQGVDTTEAGRLMEVAGRASLPRIAVNAFLLRTGHEVVLVDTGMGTLRPGFNRLPEALRAAGVSPADVTTVLLTHLHPDHVGGLASEGGSKAFPHATLVVSELETAYWLDGGMAARVPESARATFQTVADMLKPYGSSVRTFNGETEVLPGITAVPLAGHTHGHTGFLVESNNERTLIWGDIAHFPDIQGPRPQVTVGFDLDPVTAVATRQRVLARAAEQKLRVAGHHLHWPGLATVEQLPGNAGPDNLGYVIRPEPAV